MSSLKEIKTRIASVKNTRKITNAMKMVASSKLHHAQKAIENMRPYEQHLTSIMAKFLAASEGDVENIFTTKREVKSVAIVCVSSNSSLCGAFNANIIKEFGKVVDEYRARNIKVVAFPIGKKIIKAVEKSEVEIYKSYSEILDNPTYSSAVKVAYTCMQLYERGEVDEVVLLYHHFVSTSRQVVRRVKYLPVDVDSYLQTNSPEKSDSEKENLDYIVEPGYKEVFLTLLPSSLHMQIFSAVSDSLAAEHAARVIAMQTATDNADDLIDQLTLNYNKTRQQSITNELLDIASGSISQ